MLTAIGLTATIFPLIKEVPEGKLGGIKDAVMTLLKFDSKPTVFLTLDDESKIEEETMWVTVANTPLIGAKNLVAPDASMDDGFLDFAVYPDYCKAELLSYFAKTDHEGSTPDGHIQRYKARKISVGTSNFLRSSVKSVSEKALVQSKVFLAPACMPWSQNESIIPCETLTPGRLAPMKEPPARSL
ncbi:MAG: hypothetical protein PHQ40_19990 [Anaerolineaceae bacterium]|nr:hypothetical protein [Anaerolineaceae bacterium]